MKAIERWAKLIRDIGVILGVHTLIVIASNLYSVQIDVLKEQNELLKHTQYDKAHALIEAQKKLIKHEQQISKKSLLVINRLMKDIESFTHAQGEPTELSIDRFEDNIQEVSIKLKELETLISSKST